MGWQAMNSSQNQPDIRIQQSVNSLVMGLEMESEPGNRIAPARRFLQSRVLPGLKIRNLGGRSSRITQLEVRVQGAAPLWHPAGRFWLKGSTEFGFLSSEGLSLADQFRIGGLRSFRGFNENQFFTSRHLLVGLQPQFLLDSKFLLSLFCEGLLFQSGLNPTLSKEFRSALGIGIGAEWEAGSSLIQLSIASGIMKGLYPGLGTSKIHFGYIARF
jgi:outer membrane protein assembly factor BamA